MGGDDARDGRGDADDATERERNENDARGGSSHAERERWMERVDEGDAGGQREGERRRAAAAATRERVGRRARGRLAVDRTRRVDARVDVEWTRRRGSERGETDEDAEGETPSREFTRRAEREDEW